VLGLALLPASCYAPTMNRQHPLYERIKAGWVSPAAAEWMNANPEEWRSILGWEGWYEVSNHGRVRRCRAAKATFAGRALKPLVRRDGRCTVSFSGQGNQRTYQIAKLVIEAFVGPRPVGQEINHLDGNPGNNCLGNLEYCTRSENALHAYSLGLWQAKRGEDHGLAKLTNEQVIVIRACKGVVSQRLLAHAFNISRPVVKSVQSYRTWRHV